MHCLLSCARLPALSRPGYACPVEELKQAASLLPPADLARFLGLQGSELLRRLRKAWGLELPAEPAAHEEGEHGGHAHEEGPLPMFTSCCPVSRPGA